MDEVFKRFFYLSKELYLVTDDQGRIEKLNSQWDEVLGIDAQKLMGEDFWTRLHPDDQARTQAARNSARKSGVFEEIENRILSGTGQVSCLRWRGTIDPETGKFYGVATDITAFVYERERSAFLRSFIENSRDGFGYCDSGYNLLYTNKMMSEELGWDLNHKALFELVSPRTAELYRKTVLPIVLEKGEQWEGEVEFLNVKTGEFVPIWQKIFSSQGIIGKPYHIAFFATDLRTKKTAELVMLQNTKMASLGQMAASVAHEVNNPVTIIHGTTELMKKALAAETLDRSKISNGLERIGKTALRISKIVKALRMFSRSGITDPPLSVELKEIIEETLDLCRERFKDHAIELRINEVPELTIQCRPTQISQVLLNLLSNSLDAVSILNERWVAIDFEKLGNEQLLISVMDSGDGIPLDLQKYVMEPFFTTKEPGKGTGLGLPISKGIVEEHGGNFRLDTASERTRFVVELPLLRKATTQ